MKVSGLCKFLLLGTEPEFGLYVTPINIDPEHPAMPVGYPSVYSVYLAKKQGPFATLGLAEDTWALNEHVINDDQFIEQCIDMDREREAMFFDALDKVPRGLIACVFDGTDRLQHTFWRDIDPGHPARPDQDVLERRNVIGDLYRRMDDLVGKTMVKCRHKDTLLLVISDHGFGPFRRGVDLNRWLEENGYLALHDGRRGEDHLAGVDWSKTRAFAIGLAGIYINVKDKYAQGIVEPGGEADRLREEISQRLTALADPENGASAVKRVYIASKFYKGPYRENGPDLIVGYQRGYRVSWETAIGRTTEGGVPLQQESLERRPLRRPFARARHPLLQPIRGKRKPPLDRHRPHRARDVRRGRSRLHGRQGAPDRGRRRKGPKRTQRFPGRGSLMAMQTFRR